MRIKHNRDIETIQINKMEKQECQTLNGDVDVTDVSETQCNRDNQWQITTSTQVHKVRTSC